MLYVGIENLEIQGFFLSESEENEWFNVVFSFN